MKRLLHILVLSLALLAMAGTALAGGRPFATMLSGAAEVPGPGDPDGSGSVSLTINPGQEEVCFEISVTGIMLPATGAHIHIGAPDAFGGVVVPLTPPGADGTSSGCVTDVRADLLAILQDPDNYYVNVHTTDFPAGALRGQLSR
jgi:hypothetical protein